MRTIRVTGKGQIRVKPDQTRITLSLEGLYPEYGEALRRSAEDTEKIKDLLTGLGFARTDLKTLNFNVDTEYESYQVKNTYKQRFVGYKYHHQMKVEFDSDNERLGKVLYALAKCPLQPKFRLSYTVKDPEAAKNELLGKAVTRRPGQGPDPDTGRGRDAEGHPEHRLFLGPDRLRDPAHEPHAYGQGMRRRGSRL